MPWETYDPKLAMPKTYSLLSDWGDVIPTTDSYAYSFYGKELNWVYNKIKICESQNLPCGPLGTSPSQYPVIVKPIINLWGGGNNVAIAHSVEQYEEIKTAGLFWSPFHIGEHYSVDLIVLDGVVQTTFWFRGEKLQLGMFDYWEYTEGYDNYLYGYVVDWVQSNLGNYTGCVNLEVIGKYITEVHLRMGDIDRFGSQPLMEAIHILYNAKTWVNIDLEIPKSFYLAALFAQTNKTFTINEKLANALFSHLTYYQIDNADGMHSNPPGGNRLAIFCDSSLDTVCNARNIAIALFKPDIDGKYTDCLRNFEDLRI